MHTQKLIWFMVYVWSGWEILLFPLKRQKQPSTTPKCFVWKFKRNLTNGLLFETGSLSKPDLLRRVTVSPLGESPQCFINGIAQVEDLACS